jgi:phosphoenolpyruvate synthase/pyruvate phosphate dikinase
MQSVEPLALEDMQNLILKRRVVLQEAIKTLDYQINNLQKHFSRLQVREWKRNRRKLKRSLKLLPTPQQLKRSGKLITKILKDNNIPEYISYLKNKHDEKANSLPS